jgi:hypothetical protein
VVLREDRPYQLQDIDGTPITPERARQIIAERYTVPEEVRRRNTPRCSIHFWFKTLDIA